MANPQSLLATLQLLNSQTELPPSASQSSVMRNFSNSVYPNQQSVVYNVLLSNANSQSKRISSYGQQNTNDACATQCEFSNSNNQNYCTVLCNSKTTEVGYANNGTPFKLGFSSDGAPTYRTIYMYYNTSNTSNKDNVCFGVGNLYTMTFYGCIIWEDSRYVDWIQEVKKLMNWYWGFKHESGMYVDCTCPSGTYVKYDGPTIQNAYITVSSGSNNGCYHTPSVRRVCNNVEFVFPGMSVNSSTGDLEGNPTHNSSPYYNCSSCCNNFQNANCPNDNCQCIGYAIYYMYNTNQFSEYSSGCFYNVYYSITMTNMVIGYSNNSGLDKNIKKYIFWLSGLSGESLDISNFTLTTTYPGGEALMNYSVSGFGIENITKGSSCYNTPTYFDIGLTPVGNVSTPYVGGCNECPPGV